MLSILGASLELRRFWILDFFLFDTFRAGLRMDNCQPPNEREKSRQVHITQQVYSVLIAFAQAILDSWKWRIFSPTFYEQIESITQEETGQNYLENVSCSITG